MLGHEDMIFRANSGQLFTIFQKEIESLGGKVYFASDSVNLAHTIRDIAVRSRSLFAVKQRLEIRGENEITDELTRYGIRVMELENSASPVEMLSKADLAITRADMLIAQTGTLVINTSRDEERLASCLPRVHAAIVPSGKLVLRPNDTASYLREHLTKEEPCVLSLISGPSRTADIEMKLILGVHGPHEVHAIIFEG